ncbi:GRAS transcription factor [Parasponia andersonii]|uniref:GRAS transcription factor n=1 Tax=Parasponia andersonii TaxID=3476 RepID=A0A2P5DQI7_PARAD|nr:GRAS transcription factor [Parasponia andersonii]
MRSHAEEEDAVLNSISQILLEEDLEEGTCVFPDATVEAAERSFSDALGEKNSSEYRLITPRNYALSQDINIRCNTRSCNYNGSSSLNAVTAKNLDQPCLLNDVFSVHESRSYIPALPVINYNFQLGSTPLADNMIFDFEGNSLIPLKLKEIFNVVSSEEDKGKKQYEYFDSGLMKRKSLYQLEIESSAGRRNKHLAGDDSELSETFDMVLLSDGWLNGCTKMPSQSRSLSKGANIDGPTSRKRRVGEGDLLDLRTLLTHCAEAVAGNDRETAIELLLQIRTNASVSGNGSHRLAHYFANALEARMNGIGNELYTALSAKRMSILTSLKSCRLFLSACPLIKLSNFFVNHTILELAEKANALHIIHFGIVYGFQWPSFIQRLSLRPGGPPLLRITGIDLPLPGFRPAARLEETGQRLANYCKRFSVPFEYNAIAQRWEYISYEDLKIDKDEITVVNSLYRFRYLPDDTATGLNSSRDSVLNLIKSIKPDIFIHGVVNGAYNASFFMSRFREALYYFSTVFDMLEANSPPELEQDRRLCEQEGHGKEILNVLACEGSKRIERPETYKQWHARNLRAGLLQLPLNKEIMRKVKEQMQSSCYHKDFFIDEDSQWMLQGWKGRVLYALSCWKPA